MCETVQVRVRHCPPPHTHTDGRTDPMLDDVGQAFRLLGVNVSELEDYIHHLEPVQFPHQTPLFPVSKNNMLQFPQPGARDSEERKAYIPDYMPPLVSLQEGRPSGTNARVPWLPVAMGMEGGSWHQMPYSGPSWPSCAETFSAWRLLSFSKLFTFAPILHTQIFSFRLKVTNASVNKGATPYMLW